jgi:hypothetical protein
MLLALSTATVEVSIVEVSIREAVQARCTNPPANQNHGLLGPVGGDAAPVGSKKGNHEGEVLSISDVCGDDVDGGGLGADR